MKRTRFFVPIVIAAAAIAFPSPVHAQPQAGNPPVYLALGDSYPYGSNCLTNPCTQPEGGGLFAKDEQGHYIEKNDNFHVGYPVYLQQVIDRPLINPACPGDWTDSFLNYPNVPPTTGPACQRLKRERPDMLHVDYSQYTDTWAQMDYAENYLAAHGDRVVLITLQVGGPETNAFFGACKGMPACIGAGLPTHMAGVLNRLDQIISRIRAKYAGPLVYVEYPTTNYSDVFFSAIFAQIYDGIRQLLLSYNDPTIQMAPVFDAFRTATEPFGGDSCAAGLLITLPSGACNIHPTSVGHQLIADVIAQMPIVATLK